MDSRDIQVSPKTHEILRKIAAQTGDTMADIVDRAVRDSLRQRFWADYHAVYDALEADPQAWADFQAEVELWDSTLADEPG